MPSFIFPVLIVVQVVAALAVIVLVLLQQGKGADMGSAFGGGSAGSIFGSAGASNFFSRMTKYAAIVFFICTLGLAYIGAQSSATFGGGDSSGTDAGLMERFSDVPVVPGSASVEGSDVPAVATPEAAAPADSSVPSLGVPAPAAPAVEEPAVPEVPVEQPVEQPSAQ